METGLKSRSLPHRRVLITIPGRTALGKRGLDLLPRGSGGFPTRSFNSRGGCGSRGGGQGCQDKPTENGRGCALILPGCTACMDWVREQGNNLLKSRQSTAKCGAEAWRVYQERETFTGRKAIPLSQCFPQVLEIQNSTNKRSDLAPSFPHSFEGNKF